MAAGIVQLVEHQKEQQMNHRGHERLGQEQEVERRIGHETDGEDVPYPAEAGKGRAQNILPGPGR